MKKTILAIAILTMLATGNSFAQKGYQSKGHDRPVYSSEKIDNRFEEFQINKLDNIVNLTRKQANEIKEIENYYDRIAKNSRSIQTLRSTTRLASQKQKDILEVLTPAQRQKLITYQQADQFNGHNKWDSQSKYNRKS